MYRIISQYSKYFSVNSLNHPLKINVRLKRMFNMLWFEYFAIMVGNIYQMYYMKSHWWWFLLLYSNIPITWLSESIFWKKTIQSYSNIICNLDKFYVVLIKFAYLPPLNCTRDRILSLVSVQGTNGGQNHDKLIQCFIISLRLMCWLSILSKLDCFFFYFLSCIV